MPRNIFVKVLSIFLYLPISRYRWNYKNTYTGNSCISVKIGGTFFIAILLDFMLLQGLKMSRIEGIFKVFFSRNTLAAAKIVTTFKGVDVFLKSK